MDMATITGSVKASNSSGTLAPICEVDHWQRLDISHTACSKDSKLRADQCQREVRIFFNSGAPPLEKMEQHRVLRHKSR